MAAHCVTARPRLVRAEQVQCCYGSVPLADSSWAWTCQPGAGIRRDQPRCHNPQLPAGSQASPEWDLCAPLPARSLLPLLHSPSLLRLPSVPGHRPPPDCRVCRNAQHRVSSRGFQHHRQDGPGCLRVRRPLRRKTHSPASALIAGPKGRGQCAHSPTLLQLANLPLPLPACKTEAPKG